MLQPALRAWNLGRFHLLSHVFRELLDHFGAQNSTSHKHKDPEGPSSQYFKDSGPRYHSEYGFWNQKPQILDIWTLWGSHILVPRLNIRGIPEIMFCRILVFMCSAGA